MNKVLPMLVVMMLFAAPVWSVESSTAADKPSIFASHSATVSAMVEAINHETREVTLRRNGGSMVSSVVSEDVRNLGQVQAGDVVIVTYIESVNVEVITDEDAKAEVAVESVVARTKEGEMPGISGMDTVVITATVEEINIDANTFKLKGPKGNIEEYTARNPENLKKAAIGDLVVITHSRSVALTVEKEK